VTKASKGKFTMPKFAVAESIEIDAKPDDVFEVVSDFGTWTKWSPWLCAEPEANVVVTENPNSVGSGYSWKGAVVGEGGMKHTRLVPGKHIEDQLTFVKPWKSQAEVTFDFEPIGDGTKLIWTMHSALPFFMFWMKSMMVNMISLDYERGLKMLKEYIETGNVLSKTNVRGVESVGPIHMLGVRKTCKMSEIDEHMSAALGEAEQKIAAANVSHEGSKLSVYHHFDMKARTFDFTAGIMVLDSNADVPGLSSWSLPKTRAFAVEHVGSYENLGNPWGAAYQHVRYKQLKLDNKAGTFEIYRNEPSDTAPADLVTDIFLPLK